MGSHPLTVLAVVSTAMDRRPPWCRRCRARMSVLSIRVDEQADEAVIHARCDRHGETERVAIGGLDAIRHLAAARDWDRLSFILNVKCFEPARPLPAVDGA